MFVAENKSFQYSAALHIGVVLIFLIGLPSMFSRSEPQPMVLTVEILPISAVSNVKPSEKKIQEAMVAKQPIKTPPKPVTPPPATPKAAAAVPKDAVAIPDKKTPVAKVEKKTEDKEDNPDESEFQKAMRNMREEAEQTQKTDPKSTDTRTQEENKTKSDAPYDPTKPLSISQIDMIRGQFIKCWTVPAGAMNAETLISRVNVKLSQDGTVTGVALVSDQMGRYRSDPFFKAAADSAMRAVWKCSPLQNLPPDNYGAWKELELSFDPSEML